MSISTEAVYGDLHTHTLCSDGVLTPLELLERAESKGISVLSITDHDTMDAYDIIEASAYNGPVRVIPGIEISCFEHGRDVHILGYCCDRTNPDLMAYMARYRVERSNRAEAMVDKLQRLGVSITFDNVLDAAAGAPIGRPHVATALVARGMAASIQDAFDRWLDVRKPGYVAKLPFSVLDASAMIRNAGGITVVAHPGKAFTDPRSFLAIVASGIDGVEVDHPSHWPATREYYRVLAKQHALVGTGGSDYHGSRSYDDRNFGTVGASESMVSAMLSRVELRKHLATPPETI